MDLASEGLIAQQQKANSRRPVGSSQIWTRYGVLLPSQQTRKLKEWVLTDQQQQLVNASGLGHLALTTGFTIDRSLLTSFCERWNNETNTAHFMGFEMAPSLRDVSYILGIPVTGHVVTAEPIGDEAVRRMCLHYLGESPGNGEQLCGIIRLTWLYRKFSQLPENPFINDIAYSTRAYLLYLVGSTLFPDTMRGFVSPRYLPLLADFRKIREYAWGAAALAHLYRGLSVAVTPNATTQFLGSATLLMAWIYEYLPVTQPQQKNQSTLLPRACRWNFGGATRGQRKKVTEWRKVFEQLQLSEVNWNPYKDMNPAIVPEYCIAADNICYSRTWLISFNIKEVYVPDRFARQFGREQGRLHGVPMWARRTWSKWKDWRVEYAREIEEFHQLVGCRFTPSAETNINSLPPDESVAGQNATGCSQNTSHDISSMVEDLKNDLPVIDRYLEGHLLPAEVASFLERVGTMIKPIQALGQILSPASSASGFSASSASSSSSSSPYSTSSSPLPPGDVSHHSPSEVLRSFKELRHLRIELPSGELGTDDGVMLKWKADFGSTLGSCVILGASSASPSSASSDGGTTAASVDSGRSEPEECDDSGNIPESFYTNGGLRLRVVWTISSLIAAAARHYLLQPIVADHTTLESLDLTDADGQGVLTMDKCQLQELRVRPVSASAASHRTLMPELSMWLWYAPCIELPGGLVLNGATLVAIKPSEEATRDAAGNGAAVGSWVLDAFEEPYRTAARMLLKRRTYTLEMNSF